MEHIKELLAAKPLLNHRENKQVTIIIKDYTNFKHKKQIFSREELTKISDKISRINRINTIKTQLPPSMQEPSKLDKDGEPQKLKKIIRKQVKRITKKPHIVISSLEPDNYEDIKGVKTLKRLELDNPEKKVLIKVPAYYMNNREKFINFINSIFQPYRQEILNNSSNITCDDLNDNTKEFSLLTHQKLVRDYMNLYSPYRGLLLYFGLGAGKTCTSIAIAEGIKSHKKIIVLTPASLRKNYMEELKKCGDVLYRKNQFWEWIPVIVGQTEVKLIKTLSSVLNLQEEFIHNQGGAWMVNYRKPSNYDTLTQEELKSLNIQIDAMISYKYVFISYNGLRREKLREMTNNFEVNIFDNSVIIIDEVHNFISRIVNKLELEKEIPTNDNGEKTKVNTSLSLILYELLLSAVNSRIVVLTGTPIINYPNEIAVLFNVLRGYIKTWEFPIISEKTISKEILLQLFNREKLLDYLDFNKENKTLIITRNPFGFENRYDKKGVYSGISNEKDYKKPNGEIVKHFRDEITDEEFKNIIIRTLETNGFKVNRGNIKIKMYKALPDKLEQFSNMFLDASNGYNVKNIMLFKRRIMGLTSYYKSAQESLMPKYEKLEDFYVVKIPMSNYQFGIYESARMREREEEALPKKQKKDGILSESPSSYKIFSRLYCNFVMPVPPGRPLPNKEEGETKKEKTKVTDFYDEKNEDADKKEDDADQNEEKVDDVNEEVEGDETYKKRIEDALRYLNDNKMELLSKENLQIYSPKYLNILENILDDSHIGLHLIYSQFRTLEGIGIFKIVLEANGFIQFKIKKNTNGIWDLDMTEEDLEEYQDRMFALYTGTETTEEKEIIRNIYNGNWDSNSPITSKLKKLNDNNNYGEIIKVLMITASGSEGINLRNTRYVHIMEPYWNPTRIEQVIGRARRICSHTNLPEDLQTVIVFIYLMTFTQEQLKSEKSIELIRNDLSKLFYVKKDEYVYIEDSKQGKRIPITTDEVLYEIATIKEKISTNIIRAIKESSIDCAIYSKVGSKEQLHCLNFGNPSSGKFSYVPNYEKEEKDKISDINKTTVKWKAKELTLGKSKYAYREISKNNGELYDLDSYYRAIKDKRIQPVHVANVEFMEDGTYKIITIE
jgi:hypothetical protein